MGPRLVERRWLGRKCPLEEESDKPSRRFPFEPNRVGNKGRLHCGRRNRERGQTQVAKSAGRTRTAARAERQRIVKATKRSRLGRGAWSCAGWKRPGVALRGRGRWHGLGQECARRAG